MVLLFEAFSVVRPDVLNASDFATQLEQILALADLTAPPTVQDAEGFAAQEGVKAIFYDALPWKREPTKVFA
jgi:hypothetical protein